MDVKTAVVGLAALAHEGRLAVFRVLMQAGDAGLAAGEIARRVDSLPNTLSTNLGILANAGLVRSRREGRSVIYCADYGRATALFGYLLEDCCQGRPEVCGPIVAELQACCRAPDAA